MINLDLGLKKKRKRKNSFERLNRAFSTQNLSFFFLRIMIRKSVYTISFKHTKEFSFLFLSVREAS